MEVNKKQLADIFGASIRTIQNWQEQGMPVLRGGGKGNEVLYDSAAVIKWYAERDAEIENEKLRREVEELRQASETDLQPGTIEYERHRLTRAQADAQELKNARDSAEVVETAFCTFVLSRIAGEIASILDGIPLSVQRRFPELENRHVDFLKRDIIKAMNKAAALDELINMALYVSPIVSGEVIRSRGGSTSEFTPGYVKPKHEVNPQMTLRRLPDEDPQNLADPAYRRRRIILQNMRDEELAIAQVEEMQAVSAVLKGKYTMTGEAFDPVEVDTRNLQPLIRQA
ncbi:hypothetical protein GQM07_01535 [Escherichia coli]|nr:hypothetical protein [Escherichia coli]